MAQNRFLKVVVFSMVIDRMISSYFFLIITRQNRYTTQQIYLYFSISYLVVERNLDGNEKGQHE